MACWLPRVVFSFVSNKSFTSSASVLIPQVIFSTVENFISKLLLNFIKILFASSFMVLSFYVIVKLREREGQRVDLGRSLKGHL